MGILSTAFDTVVSLIKAPFVFVANLSDGWSAFSGSTLKYFMIGGALLGGFLLGGMGLGVAGGMLAGALGGAALSMIGGIGYGAITGGYESVATVVDGVRGKTEVADAEEEPTHGVTVSANKDRGSLGRA